MLRRFALVLVALAIAGAFGSPARASLTIEPRGNHDVAGELLQIARSTEGADESRTVAEKQLPSKPLSLTASGSLAGNRFTLRDVVDECPLRPCLSSRSKASAQRSAALAAQRAAAVEVVLERLADLPLGVDSTSDRFALALDLRQLANPPPEKGFRLFAVAARTNETARARWYDARNGAFLSEDPLGTVDSPNLYAFVGHLPHAATDPLGECLGLSNVPCSRHADQLHEAAQRRFPNTGHRGIDALNRVGEAILLLPADTALRLGEGLGKLYGRLEGMARGHVPPMRSRADLRREMNAAALDLVQAAGDAGALYGGGRALTSFGASTEVMPAVRGLLRGPAPQPAPAAVNPWIRPGDLLPDGRIAGMGPGAALRDSPEFSSIAGGLSRGEVGELLGRPDVRFASTVQAGAARPPRHHLFVQDYREWFQAHGVDIDRYTIELGVGEHTAVHTMGFNQRWGEFVAAEASRSTPYSTREVLAFGAKLRRDFKLEGHPLVPFKD